MKLRATEAAIIGEWCEKPGHSFEHRTVGILHWAVFSVEGVASRIGIGLTFAEALRRSQTADGLAQAAGHNREMIRFWTKKRGLSL